jgi:acetyl-CoA C-acetyltransferase
LVREAATRALDDAALTWRDIDAVVIGKAPDMFEGVVMPELYLADALGAVGKPLLRVHTAGSVGGSTAIVAAKLVMAGIHKRVLTVAFEKQSESNATWGLSVQMPFSAPLVAGAGGYFAPLIRAYIARSRTQGSSTRTSTPSSSARRPTCSKASRSPSRCSSVRSART